MKFCNTCGQILKIDVSSDKLYFKCNNCDIKLEGKEDDYVLYTEQFTVKNNIQNLLSSVKYNPTIPRKYMNCPKCKKEELIFIIRENDTLKATYVCNKCENYFT